MDDDIDLVDAVRLILERDGHRVASASNREEGMRQALGDKPDLLILDIMMAAPDDGIAMAQELRKAGFAQPILMMSSISRATGLSYGRDDAITPVDDFVDKPVAPDTLRAKVQALLGGAKEGTC
ncbi:MAG: response regulator [Phycisphaerae bacterium]